MAVFDGDVFDTDVFDAALNLALAPVVIEWELPPVDVSIPFVVTPAAVVIEWVIPEPDISLPITLTPAAVIVEWTIPAPRVVHRSISIDPVIVEWTIPAVSLGYAQNFDTDPVAVEWAFPTAHVITGTGRTRRVVRHHGIFVRAPHWPRQRIAELTTSFSPDCAFVLMEAGQASVSINRNDSAARLAKLEGYLLEIDQEGQPPWIGVIRTPRQSLRAGVFEVSAVGYAAILDGHTTPQDEVYRDSIASGQIFRSLLTRMNARDDTGIRIGRVENGPSINDLEVGGQSVLEAFINELHERSDMEWSLEWDISPGHAEAYLNWEEQVGIDLSASVHLWSNIHFADLEYVPDLSKAVQAVTTTGGLGRPLEFRNSVTRMGATEPLRRDIGGFDRARLSEPAIRLIADLPAGLRTEKIVHVMGTEDIAELSRHGGTTAHRRLQAVETFTGDVNELVDWNAIRVGNYVTLHADFGQGFMVRRARVKATQPARDMGLIQTVFEVAI